MMGFKGSVKLVSILSFVLFFNIAFIVNAQVLWQNTEYGMSVNQVKTLYPTSVNSSNPSIIGKDKPNEAKGILVLNNFEIVNHKFDVTFYFTVKENKLSQVTLTCNEKITVHEGELIYDSLFVALTAKYSNVLNSKKDKIGDSNFWSAQWFSNGTNISLNYITIGKDDKSPILNIVYQVRLLEELNKL